MNDEFFSGLIGELEEQSYSDHPPELVLRRYLRRRLPDEDRFSKEAHDLLADTRGEERWTLTAVSLHVATCGECAERVARLRAAMNPLANHARRGKLRLSPPRIWKRRWAYYIPVASAIVGLILLFLFWHFPQSLTPHCTFGALAM